MQGQTLLANAEAYQTYSQKKKKTLEQMHCMLNMVWPANMHSILNID